MKIPYYNGEPHWGSDPQTATHDLTGKINPASTSDISWYNHRQAPDVYMTDFDLRTTTEDAIFWLRTR